MTKPFSFMKGKLGRYLDLDEHLALGVTIAWYPGFTHHVTWAALWDFMTAFQSSGVKAWDAFVESRRDRPSPYPKCRTMAKAAQSSEASKNGTFQAIGTVSLRLNLDGVPVSMQNYSWFVQLVLYDYQVTDVTVLVRQSAQDMSTRNGSDPA